MINFLDSRNRATKHNDVFVKIWKKKVDVDLPFFYWM